MALPAFLLARPLKATIEFKLELPVLTITINNGNILVMLWIKAFHLIAVICWFAMLFYLPRLFVYHAMSEDQTSRERFKIMEHKLYRIIGTPSMIVTLVLGFWLSSLNWDYYQATGWYWTKLTLVVSLVIFHFSCGRYIKQFRDDHCHRSHRFFRGFNEFPILPMVAIVILAVVKPF